MAQFNESKNIRPPNTTHPIQTDNDHTTHYIKINWIFRANQTSILCSRQLLLRQTKYTKNESCTLNVFSKMEFDKQTKEKYGNIIKKRNALSWRRHIQQSHTWCWSKQNSPIKENMQSKRNAIILAKPLDSMKPFYVNENLNAESRTHALLFKYQVLVLF